MIEFTIYLVYLVIMLFSIFIITPFLTAHERWFFQDNLVELNKTVIRCIGILISLLWPIALPILTMLIPAILLGRLLFNFMGKCYNYMEALFTSKLTKR